MNACFFDMDGTLIDSRADLVATVNHTRNDLGLAALPEADVLSCVGQGAKYLLEHAIPECVGKLDEANACFMRRYAEHCCDRVELYPGVMRTLEALASRGWHLGIVTNKPAFATRRRSAPPRSRRATSRARFSTNATIRWRTSIPTCIRR